MKRIFLLFFLLVVLIFMGVTAGLLKFDPGNLSNLFQTDKRVNIVQSEKVKISSEESVIIDVVEKVSSSVVTVAIVNNRSIGRMFEINPNDPFNIFGAPGGSQKTEQDIGTGFIVSSDGLIVTNKHVVSSTGSKYKVVTKDDKSFEVQKIYRDPVNDLAILKINASGLTSITIGNSSKLKVGQMAIAIGTALGEFRN
ncbi:serine protease, partial [Candidatus Gottesmanbacteria bacterium]|nr:serine protease [Candidatus Gottesmanbacteria bacterium]